MHIAHFEEETEESLDMTVRSKPSTNVLSPNQETAYKALDGFQRSQESQKQEINLETRKRLALFETNEDYLKSVADLCDDMPGGKVDKLHLVSKDQTGL